MRESIGGTWLFGIVILFIALFASFLAYSINYTRAFNLKNQIINLIERNEGYSNYKPTDDGSTSSGNVETLTDEQLMNDSSVEAQAYYYIKHTGYNYTAAENIDCTTIDFGNDRHADHETKTGGYCVTKYCNVNEKDTSTQLHYGTYYKVTTFIAMKLPVVNITFKVPISGETKTLYYDVGNIECQRQYVTAR